MASYGHRFAMRPLVALVFAVALLAAPAWALASSDDQALSQERYYQSYKAFPAGSDTDAALAQEQYYSSYGSPTPIPHATTGGGSSDAPFLIAGVSLAAIFLLAGSALTIRHRRTAGSPA
jgi:hypothetical protein